MYCVMISIKNNNLEFGYYLIEQDLINSGLGIVMGIRC